MLTHVVLFKLADPTAENIAAFAQKLQSLEGRVPQLRGIEVGTDVVRSERSCDVALITRFDSLADMEAYQVHPYHQEVLGYVKRVITKAHAVDFDSW